MDLAGLIDSIITATASIDYGRKGFATRGKEQEGRINYEDGITKAMSAFQKAQASADPETIILGACRTCRILRQIAAKFYDFWAPFGVCMVKNAQKLCFFAFFLSYRAKPDKLLAEYTFLSQELEFCEKTDKDSLSSLTKAIQSFDDAFLALEVVKDKTLYQGVDKAIPHSGKHRVKGFPMDAYHIACHSHKTRLRNILKTPGLDPIEKALLKQRLVNLSAGQGGYVEKQGIVLAETMLR